MVDFPATYAEYLKGRGKGTQKEIRHLSNRIRKQFGNSIRFTSFRHREEYPAAIAAVDTISSRTYHRHLIGGFTDTPELRSMWAYAAERAAFRARYAHRRATGRILYGFVYRKRYVGHFTGYDPDYADFQPGKFLRLRMFEKFCENQEVTIADFAIQPRGLQASTRYLRHRRGFHIYFCADVPRSEAQPIRLLTSGTKQAVKSVLVRTNMLNGLKRSLKRWATQQSERA